MRKHPTIDVMRLYAHGSANGWNEFLTKCLKTLDINSLAAARYGIQAGMSDLANAGLNTPELDVWFARLVRSIEVTARKIIKIRHPFKPDDPLKTGNLDALAAKRKRDEALAKFLMRSSF